MMRYKVCAWCKKVKTDGHWVTIADPALARVVEANATHSICPACLKRMDEEIDSLPATDNAG
jgi:hypothetical protein